LLRAILLAVSLAFLPACAYGARLPLLRAFFGKQTFSETVFAEIITKLNSSARYRFSPAFRDEKISAYYSDLKGNNCWFKQYDLDDTADAIQRELAGYRQAVFRYGNLVGYCHQGDTAAFAVEVRSYLAEAGKWKEEKP
jgi:hypothetical protein